MADHEPINQQYVEGYEAFCMEVSRESNPYTQGVEMEQWFQGWDDALSIEVIEEEGEEEEEEGTEEVEGEGMGEV